MAVKFKISDTNAQSVNPVFGNVSFAGSDFIINDQPGGVDGAVRQMVVLGGLALFAWAAVQFLKRSK